jgi:ribose transport system substrate-binding protein
MNEIKKTIINDLIIVTLAILLLVLLRVRDYKNEDMISASMNRYYDIYLITIDNVDQYWYDVNQGAYDMAGMLEVNYKWEAPETKDIQKQIELLNQVVEKGADAVLIAVNDPIQMSSAIENAKAKGVKIIYVDSPAYEEAVTTLATDNYSAGIEAGEAMIHELGALGIESGRIGIIGVNDVTDSTLKREAGFREAMRLDGRFTLVPTDYQNGDPIASQEAASLMIRNYPDLVGLFGTNEGSTIGVGTAIKSQRRQIIGIGFDKSDVILELLRDGSLDAIVTQNPYTMGYFGMAEAVASLKGMDTGPSSINTGVSIIRRR